MCSSSIVVRNIRIHTCWSMRSGWHVCTVHRTPEALLKLDTLAEASLPCLTSSNSNRGHSAVAVGSDVPSTSPVPHRQDLTGATRRHRIWILSSRLLFCIGRHQKHSTLPAVIRPAEKADHGGSGGRDLHPFGQGPNVVDVTGTRSGVNRVDASQHVRTLALPLPGRRRVQPISYGHAVQTTRSPLEKIPAPDKLQGPGSRRLLEDRICLPLPRHISRLYSR